MFGIHFRKKAKTDIWTLSMSVQINDLKNEILRNLVPKEFCQHKDCLKKASNKYFTFEVNEDRKTGKRWIVITGRD